MRSIPTPLFVYATVWPWQLFSCVISLGVHTSQRVYYYIRSINSSFVFILQSRFIFSASLSDHVYTTADTLPLLPRITYTIPVSLFILVNRRPRRRCRIPRFHEFGNFFFYHRIYRTIYTTLIFTFLLFFSIFFFFYLVRRSRFNNVKRVYVLRQSRFVYQRKTCTIIPSHCQRWNRGIRKDVPTLICVGAGLYVRFERPRAKWLKKKIKIFKKKYIPCTMPKIIENQLVYEAYNRGTFVHL